MNTIQSALRNVVSREAERLKQFDFSSEKMDDAIHLVIPGILCGIALTALTIKAGGVTELPAYTAAHLQTWKDQVVNFAMQNQTALTAAGSVIAGGGAVMFLKGLKEENDELRARWRHAFNPKGHGAAYINEVEQTTDKLLSTQQNVVREVARQEKWADFALTDLKVTNLMILRTMGYDVAADDQLATLQDAYIFGVKKACADALDTKRDIINGFDQPNYLVERSIIEGMTEYFRATAVKEPGLADKLKFVFFGDDEILKDRTKAYQTAHAGYKAIKKIRTITPQEASADEFSL
ncbi:hypothetical protein [Pseudomonas serbica]|jgi:hypothetical protein|uniref:hypothetical protein n=1 Tax=Pseudomonas serbica TaxID=2965074 RepID=UPI00237B23E0|nr:hypothetical protein [Pseudomonas serbica]